MVKAIGAACRLPRKPNASGAAMLSVESLYYYPDLAAAQEDHPARDPGAVLDGEAAAVQPAETEADVPADAVAEAVAVEEAPDGLGRKGRQEQAELPERVTQGSLFTT